MRRRPPGLAGIALAAVLACACTACTACSRLTATATGADGERVVLTQVPEGLEPFPLERLDPDARYPKGSRVVVSGIPDGDAVRVLSRGLEAAGAPRVSPGADAVVFAARAGADARWAVWEAPLDGGRPRPVRALQHGCIDPAYLGDGRVVATCESGTDDAARGWSLHVTSRDHARAERITFGPGSALDPVPLPDGRILFSMWQGAGAGRPAEATALFTVNPDGTLLEPFAGSHDGPGLKVRARTTADGGVVYIAASVDGTAAKIERVEMRRPLATRRDVAIASGDPSAPCTALPIDPVAVERTEDGGLLVTGREAAGPGTPGGWGVFRVGPEETVGERVLDSPGWNVVEATPVRRGPVPRGRPSSVKPAESTGTLVCYDARRSDGTAAVEAHDSMRVEAAGPGGVRDLGAITVEPDGSFLVEVPADVPLRVVATSAGGTEAASEWFWVRPGEARACFGCHESRESAPVNRPVAALTREPDRLLAHGEEVRP